MTEHIISLSGGKDSTAMLHMMLERGEKIAAAVFFDTGWEFPQMYEHISQVENKTGVKIWTLKPRMPFEYIMLHKPIKQKDGSTIYGKGWPSFTRRWCTQNKVDALNFFAKQYRNPVQCIGIAEDELSRVRDNPRYPARYPLIEYGVTEKLALEYCLGLGYTWGGLYEHFSRVSCYCCPLQNINSLKNLWKFYPQLWQKMLYQDLQRPKHNLGFRGSKSLSELTMRFLTEEFF